MTQETLPSTEEWTDFDFRLRVKYEAITRAFLIKYNDGDTLKAYEDKQALIKPHMARIYSHYNKGKERNFEYLKYTACHLMIGSTNDQSLSPLMDFPGELSIEKLLDGIIRQLDVPLPRVQTHVVPLQADEAEKLRTRLYEKKQAVKQIFRDAYGDNDKEFEKMLWVHRRKIYEHYEPADYLMSLGYGTVHGDWYALCLGADFSGEMSAENFLDDIISGVIGPKCSNLKKSKEKARQPHA